MPTFENKIALVTGGTQGMGLVTAIALAKAGATVVISGRNERNGAAARQQIEACGARASFIASDSGNAASVERLIGSILEAYGRLDVAFNNAGVTSAQAPLADASLDDWHRTMSINVNGTFYSMKYEIAAMLRGNGGAIVNNSSVVGIAAVPNQVAYVTSKTAIIGLTRSGAIEYAQKSPGRPQIRVNAIAPGPILGGMNNPENLARDPERTARKEAFAAMKRFGTPEEVASTVLWLLSDESSYLTGAVIPLDGGATVGKPM
jgi:NAD(P)-dependent dehydrogenase (short-subunit alcohol dehydrogenase family)